MARYIGSVCRLCRREGTKLFLKGERCYSTKCSYTHRVTPPGQHGTARKKTTEYSMQLREKQKAKRIYGILEKQFKLYYNKADRMRGMTGENMFMLIERRLDNVVYKLGLGMSRAQARQIINHGHINVNGKTVDIPSYLVKLNDVITVKSNKKDKGVYAEIKNGRTVTIPKWLTFDSEALQGVVIALPQHDDLDLQIADHLIVELYSK